MMIVGCLLWKYPHHFCASFHHSDCSKFCLYPVRTVDGVCCLAMRSLGITNFTPKDEADHITLEMFSKEAYVTSA